MQELARRFTPCVRRQYWRLISNLPYKCVPADFVANSMVSSGECIEARQPVKLRWGRFGPDGALQAPMPAICLAIWGKRFSVSTWPVAGHAIALFRLSSELCHVYRRVREKTH
jgi:hypothetical protein